MNNNEQELVNLFKLIYDAYLLEQEGAVLKSNEIPHLNYSYSYQLDLGQGRTRSLNLSFQLNKETNTLELIAENISDA